MKSYAKKLIIATPLEWNVSPSQDYPPLPSLDSLTFHRYQSILLNGETHCDSNVTRSRTQYNKPCHGKDLGPVVSRADDATQRISTSKTCFVIQRVEIYPGSVAIQPSNNWGLDTKQLIKMCPSSP